MTNAKFNFLNRTLAAGAVLAGALLASQSALACTLDNWSTSFGSVVAGDPLPPTSLPNQDAEVARYAGFCGMRVTGSGYVQDNNPGGINRIVARFYVLNDLSAGQVAVIYAGYGDQAGGGERFTVTLDDSGDITLADSANPGTPVEQTGSATGWSSVEIDWAEGDSISLSVNGQSATVQNIGSASGSLSSVRLGNLGGATGALNFDAYESRRSTAVGRLVACNAQDSDNDVNILDALAVVNELNEAGLSSGTPDCTENGTVDILDVLEIVNIINS